MSLNCKKSCHDKIRKNFHGLNGTSIVPSDSNCAVGEKDYIAMINSSIIFYDKCSNKINAQYYLSYNTNSSIITTTPFFEIQNSISDPYIIYDPHVKRFVLVCLVVNSDGVSGSLNFAISKKETFCHYLNDWYKYSVPLNYTAGTYFPDYPKIGFDQTAYYITSRIFNTSGTLVENNIFGFTKKEVMKGYNINQVVNLSYTYTPNYIDFIFPLKVYDCNTPMYFIYSDTTNNPATNIYFIGILNYTTIIGPITQAVEAYYQPSSVPQYGGTYFDSLGTNFSSGCVRHGHLWSADTIGLSDGKVKVRWYDFIVSYDVFTVNQYETLAPTTTVYYWMSHLDVDHKGNMGIGFSSCDVSDPLGAGISFTGRLKDEIPYLTHPIKLAKAGEGIYTVITPVNRWGDYSGLCFDPCKSKQFWMFNQYGYNSSLSTYTFKTQNIMFLLRKSECCKVPYVIPTPSACPEEPSYPCIICNNVKLDKIPTKRSIEHIK